MAFEYTTKIYLDAVNGDDITGDGSSVSPYQFFDTSPAKGLVEAGVAYQYNIIFKTGSSENININLASQPPSIAQPFVKFTAANGAIFSGTGDFVSLNQTASQSWGVWFVGFEITNYTRVTYNNTYFGAFIFQNCNIYSTTIWFPQAGKGVILDTKLKDLIIAGRQATGLADFPLHHLVNVEFDNVATDHPNQPFISPVPSAHTYGNVGGFTYACKYNRFKNMPIALGIQTVGDREELMYNNYENVQGSFYDLPLTVPLPTLASLVPFNSVAAMQAEYLSVFGVPTTLYEQETFKTIPVDAFGFPTDETVNELNRQQGANRYALSQVTPVANADYTFVTDHYVSNKTSPTPLVYELTAPRAGRFRRLELQFIRNGNTEQLSATSGEVEITLEKSTDGVNFAPVGTFLSGIDSSTLEFDYVLEIGKAYKASIQPVGAAFGEIEFYGIVGTINTMEDEINQSFTRVLVEQKGNNLLAETPIKYLVNPLNSNYRFYDPIRVASQVIDPVNEFNNTYELSANELITRTDDPANPILPSTVGHMEIIYQDNDPITNPYNLEGYSMMTTEGLVIVKLKE